MEHIKSIHHAYRVNLIDKLVNCIVRGTTDVILGIHVTSWLCCPHAWPHTSTHMNSKTYVKPCIHCPSRVVAIMVYSSQDVTVILGTIEQISEFIAYLSLDNSIKVFSLEIISSDYHIRPKYVDKDTRIEKLMKIVTPTKTLLSSYIQVVQLQS